MAIDSVLSVCLLPGQLYFPHCEASNHWLVRMVSATLKSVPGFQEHIDSALHMAFP